jgi:DNA-binding CsgD family transcriptional regulator
MAHVVIWIQIVTLMAGTAVLFETLRIYRSRRYPFLKPMGGCLLCLNLSFLANAVSDYLLVNFFGDLALFKSSIYMHVADPLSGLFFVGLVYFMVRLSRSLLDRRPIRRLPWIFATAGLIIVVRTLVAILSDPPASSWRWLDGVYIGVMISLFLVAYGLLVHFVLAGRRLADDNTSKMLTTLGLFYLGGCTLILVSSMVAGPWHRGIHGLIALLFNLFPFYWYRRYLFRLGNALPYQAAAADLERLRDQYGISARQLEILELLLHGKSNREIAAVLFIAPHTVKNHIYGLYQKLGVKSRFELVNLLLEYVKK